MDILSTVFSLFALLFAITIHEASHAWSALRFGDPTSASMGRVSLNPLAHIDPIGTVLLPILCKITGAPLIGWAKPVMVNPRNLRHPRRDNLWISFAGPAANLTAAAVSLLLILVIKAFRPNAIAFLAQFLNKERSFPAGFYPVEGLVLILFFFVWINTYLAFFNLIPVPPLDGSGILMGLLPSKAAASYAKIRPFPHGLFIIIVLIQLGILDVIVRQAFTIIGKILSS